MTTTKAENFSMAIAAAPMSLEDKLGWHFATLDRIPKSMLPICAAAIRLHDAGYPERTTMLTLPIGVSFEGAREVSIGDVIAGHYLEVFLAVFADYVPASPLDVPLYYQGAAA